MSYNPIQSALDFLVDGGSHQQRAIAIRTSGDGTYSLKSYINAVPQGEVLIGGKRELDEALASLTFRKTARSSHEDVPDSTPQGSHCPEEIPAEG